MSIRYLKSKLLKTLILISPCLIIVSCTGYQYVANPLYVPLNEKKGEVKVNTTFTSVQLGYTPTDHIGIFLTGFTRSLFESYSSGTYANDDGIKYHREDNGYQIDAGASYFNKLGKFNYEILSGIGTGQVDYSNRKDLYNDYQFDYTSDRFNFFIQPDIGLKIVKVLELGLCSRFNYYRYYNIEPSWTLGDNNTLESDDINFLTGSTLNLAFWEPGFSFKVGYDRVKFHLMIMKTHNLTNHDINFREINIYMGVSVSFDTL